MKHEHLAEWNDDRTKLYLHVPGHVDTCGIVEWSESMSSWWWWCLHSSCNENAPAMELDNPASAWADFLDHERAVHHG